MLGLNLIHVSTGVPRSKDCNYARHLDVDKNVEYNFPSEMINLTQVAAFTNMD